MTDAVTDAAFWVILKEQMRLAQIARVLLGRLSADTRQELSKPWDDGNENERQIVADWLRIADEPVEVVRMTAALAEATLTLDTLLSERRGEKLTAVIDGGNVSIAKTGKHIPPSYFSARISGHAQISLQAAREVWLVICQAIDCGTVAIPGLGRQVSITLTDD